MMMPLLDMPPLLAMPCAIYDRISDDKTGRQAGVERQREDNIKTAQDEGATDLSFYRDNDISASKVDVVRPDFERLMADIRAGKFDNGMVICWAQDRIARQGIEFEQLLVVFEKHNIRFLARTDAIDMRPNEGALYPRIRAAVAAEEIRKLRARVLRSLEQNRAQGRRHGKLPFGWNLDGSINEEEAGLVVEATNRILAGESMGSIAQDWESRPGVPRLSYVKRKNSDGTRIPLEEQVPIGSEWNSKRIKHLVTRASNVALQIHGDKVLDVPGSWEPILTEEKWKLVCTRLANRKIVRRPDRSSLLSSILKCGKDGCASPVWSTTNRSEGYTYRIYRCGNPRCQQSTRVDKADNFVEYLVVDRLKSITAANLAGRQAQADLESAMERLKAVQERMNEMDDRYSDMDRPDAINGATHARLTAALRPKLIEAQRQVEALVIGEDNEMLDGAIGDNADLAWDQFSLARRREIVRRMMKIELIPSANNRAPVDQRLRISWLV